MQDDRPTPRVVVIGAGASGSLTALHLARAARRRGTGLEVVLVDPAAHRARGTAFGTTDPQHLLNVAAGGMSALPEDPGHFVAWRARQHPELMTEPLPEAEGGVSTAAIDSTLELAQDVIACGPGLGRTRDASGFVRALVDRATVPLVLDADALTLLAEEPGRLLGRDDRDVIITPHPGEMARLAGMTVDEVQANRLQVAADFATTHRVYVVLKGHRTVIATPTGRTFINPTGNPGMATAGTGDVLTGMIAAWLAQLLDADAACRLAVFLHGAAGDLAAGHEGRVSMIAGDVINHIGPALEQLSTPAAGEGRDS